MDIGANEEIANLAPEYMRNTHIVFDMVELIRYVTINVISSFFCFLEVLRERLL